MLELNSPRWEELSHAYGEASNIPGLIEQLKITPPSTKFKSEPWYSIWSSLCHQNDVYTASYAAVPHIVASAATKPVRERLAFFNFVTWVEVCRHRRTAPTMPSDLESAYSDSLQHTRELLLECFGTQWDEDEQKILLGALAVVQGQPRLGAAIIDLEKDTDCPNCNKVFLTKGYDLFS